MSRYIDADALKTLLIETLEAIRKNPKMDNQEAHLIAGISMLGKMIDDAKTVDAVEVVRCKDFRYWEEITPASDNCHYGKCGDADCYSPEWWFCADGERREVTE